MLNSLPINKYAIYVMRACLIPYSSIFLVFFLYNLARIFLAAHTALSVEDTALLFSEELGNHAIVNFRLTVLWFMGTTFRFVIFRPKLPAGRDGASAWTTEGSKIIRTTQTSVDAYPSLRVTNGPINVDRLGFATYRATTSRIDDQYCEYVFVPRPFKFNRINWLNGHMEECQDILERHDQGFAVRREMDDKDVHTYVARTGFYGSVAVGAQCWEAILNACAVSGKEVTAYSIGKIAEKYHPDITPEELVTLQSLVACYWNQARIQNIRAQRPAHVAKIQFVGDKRDDNLAPDKPTGRTVLPYFVSKPNTAPRKGYQADISAVHYRIDTVRNKNTQLSSQAKSYVDEFVEMLNIKRIQPWELEAVIEHQDGPLQRKRNERVKHFMHSFAAKVKAMVKVEPVSNDGPVRNISTLPAEFNLINGRYMLAAAEWFKSNTEWYLAGKKPGCIAERIVEIASFALNEASYSRAAKVCCADVSKMDAAKHPYLQAWLTTRIYARLFGFDSEELFELRTKEAAATAITDSGVPYEIGASQLSGSACTTIDNTITNAFLSFAAYRLGGDSKEDAYQMLGAYVGDDSVSNNDAESMEAAGQMYGYTIKAEMVGYGEHIPFLSRYFYAAWHGEPYSLQDPKRLMAKAHLSFSPPCFSDLEAATNKFRGYSELDPAVRVYGHIFDKLKELGGDTGRMWDGDVPYNSKNGAWPTSFEAQDIWTGITGCHVRHYYDWLRNIKSYEQLLASNPPIIENDAPDKPTITIDPDAIESTAETSTEPVHPDATVAAPPNNPGVVTARAMANEAVQNIEDVQKVEEFRAKLNKRAAMKTKAAARKKPNPLPMGGVWYNSDYKVQESSSGPTSTRPTSPRQGVT